MNSRKISIRELVKREEKLQDKINFNLEELAMISDLKAIPKYIGSKELDEKFLKLEEKTRVLLMELKTVKEQINGIDDVMNCIIQVD